MAYIVTGNGLGGVQLEYFEQALENARYLASKMKDNGVANVAITDELGNAVRITEDYRYTKAHWRSDFR
ncbi:hypothetical protein [Novosphingobium sp.]|uniref:hypothetical protein n=1 Tax=Novosphingobium sp. TaxID=1874826 RepID=UPI00286DB5ED|nr:hypothetical protein [Novosphingobium sp.]